jgi:hypothetical protein
MNQRALAIALFTVVLCFGAALQERRVDFETDETGKSPKFFITAVNGDYPAGKWVVEEAGDAPSGRKVLAQRDAAPAEDRFALCLYQTDKVADADVEVQLKCIAGEEDRCGGVVVRCLDRNNYYVARASASEDNVHLYSVVQGKRTRIAAQPVIVDKNKWHKLRVVARGRHFQVFFNDVMLFEADDDAFRDPGNVGIWTKADAITLFDDLVIKPVAEQQAPKK